MAIFNWKPKLVLPTVYDDALSYQEILGKVIDALNQMGETGKLAYAVFPNGDPVVSVRDNGINVVGKAKIAYMDGKENDCDIDVMIPLAKGDNVNFAVVDGVVKIFATDTTYTGGSGIVFEGTVVKANYDEVQRKLTAGEGITISEQTIAVDPGRVEVIENKTNTLSADSTAVQYPSAKAVYDKVTAVEEVANTANSRATTAQATANDANEVATSARSKANSAKTAAEQAGTKADEAKTQAANALDTADAAQEAATLAKNKADQNELTISNVQKTTTTEINALKSDITDIKSGKIQQTPLFANSIAELTASGDTTKLYVLPDGYIYAYIKTETTTPNYTNRLPLAINENGSVFNVTGYKNGFRLSSSLVEKEQTGCGYTGFIPATTGDVIRIKNIPACTTGYGYVHYFNSSFAQSHSGTSLDTTDFVPDSNGVGSFTISSPCDYIRLSYGNMSADSIITINEEITVTPGTTVIDYQWANTGHAFVPADYEGRIVDLENKVAGLETDVASESGLLFISPVGDDSNSGLTASTPKKTVKACVNAGATRISAKRGVYNEFIQLWNVGELEIFPTDNDLTYSVGEEREPIVFDTSDSVEVSSLVTYNSIKRVAYSNAANTQFDKVFTKKSQPPIVGDGYGSRYNSTIWLLSNDEKTVCIKLKPVLTVAECETETNTFTYVDGYIYINADMSGVEKIIVPTNWETGIYINGADRLVLKEVEVRFSGTYNIDIRNCAYFDFYKCSCKYTSYGSGFHPFNSNGIMTACYATKNFDGYGISGYGHTTYVDCVSEFNFDDGMSHHDGTSGTVIGGRYEGNGKGGNTPAYGAKVNIYGGIYKNNVGFGIGYLWASGLSPASGLVQGAVMVGNPKGLVVNANCSVTAISCLYKNNTTDKDINGLLTEYNY